jgi:hypothetical protein
MRRLLPEQKEVFHLQEYTVWKNENGTYEYMAGDAKTDKLRMIMIRQTDVAQIRHDPPVAHTIPQIDAEIAEKGHLWMETGKVFPNVATVGFF